MAYRKLTIEEARRLLIKMQPNTQALRTLVRDAFGENAYTFMVWSTSDYNDEYYENSYMFDAFDADGNGLDGYVDEDNVLPLLGVKNHTYRTEEAPDPVRMLINLNAPDTTINLFVEE